MELTAGRCFADYGASMDAVLQEKLNDIEPWLVDGLIVDRGCGTGALMKALADRKHKVVGIELSEKLAAHNHGVVSANVMDPVFADGFVSNIILSSVMHEVYSYNNYSMYPVMRCLSNCVRELRSGGRIIIRDIWAPEKSESFPDYAFKVDKKVYKKFKDFLSKSPDKLDGEYSLNGMHLYLSTRLAVEFLSKKDYDKHWALEMKEVYTSVPMSAYKEMAEALRCTVIVANPFANKWIIENRWRKGVEGELPRYTNQLIVLEKL